jgi:NADH:ubiquinone oxidoreductase subunit B-like Fe-S oxidoreductase
MGHFFARCPPRPGSDHVDAIIKLRKKKISNESTGTSFQSSASGIGSTTDSLKAVKAEAGEYFLQSPVVKRRQRN